MFDKSLVIFGYVQNSRSGCRYMSSFGL